MPTRAVRWTCAGLALSMLLLLIGCDSAREPTQPLLPSSRTTTDSGDASQQHVTFQDITSAQGLSSIYHNGEEAKERSIIESLGGGVAVIDFDRDGWDDLFFPGGGQLENKSVTGLASSLWHNRDSHILKNVSSAAHIDVVAGYTHGAVSADWNNDGFSDLLVSGYSGLQLFTNQGDGTFFEHSLQAGLDDSQWSTSTAFADLDCDGDLDLYVTHYVNWSWSNHPACESQGIPDICAPGAFTAIPDVIYFNNGNGSFEAKSSEVGLAADGKGLGVLATDLDRDGWVDLYVANDTTNNFLYQNLRDGTLQEIALTCGTAYDNLGTPQGSMGLCTLDYDQDLKPDIWVCNYENQAFALYKNDGDFFFRYVTSAAGLMALGTTYVAFGTSAADFDLDGDEDIVVANGHVMRFVTKGTEQQALYLNNLGNGRFVRQTFPSDDYFSKTWRGRGVVAFDYDHDGDMDLVFTNTNQPAALLQNNTASTGKWLILELVGVHANRDAIGASVVIHTTKRQMLRNVSGGGSYLSQNPYYLHAGLTADEELVRAEILWPSGHTQIVEKLATNSRTLIVESSDD